VPPGAISPPDPALLPLAASRTAPPPAPPASLCPCQRGVRSTHAANRRVAATTGQANAEGRAKFLLNQR